MPEQPSNATPESLEQARERQQELARDLGTRTNLLTVEAPSATDAKFGYMGIRRLPDGSLDWSAAVRIELPRTESSSEHDQTEELGANPEALSVHDRLARSIDEIRNFPEPKADYSLEDADRDRPYTHYTQPGNIFQILRFGIQSGNFKNRVNDERRDDPSLDDIAPLISGLRYQKGGSYQGKDSISLGLYSDQTLRSENFVLLVDPDTKVFGASPVERDSSTGYGHGIVSSESDNGFAIGNPTAYQTEVLAANVIPPSEIKGVVLNKRASILSSLRELTRNSATLYSQAKLDNPEGAKEDLLATSRLIAKLSGDPTAENRVDELAQQVDQLPTVDLMQSLNMMNRELLRSLVGPDTPLNEESLRDALEAKFKVKFIVADGEVAA
jgi:hypothetical protein